MNTYKFAFTHIDSGSLLGCFIDAPTPQDAWAQFESRYPPRRYIATRMSLFWDGVNNYRATRYYDIATFTP